MVRGIAFVFSAPLLAGAYCGDWKENPSRSKDFPPGWNGLAMTPPMGWRSWNAFGTRISQASMETVVDALAERTRAVIGHQGNASLCDLGYCSVGVDEGWEGCGQGVNGTQHDLDGTPEVNEAKFPDLAGLVKYSHDRGVELGWYQNGCGCAEKKEPASGWEVNYEGDVRMLNEMGLDAVKMDGCGRMCNMTLYADLMRETGRSFKIENCHWGRCSKSDDSSCPTQDWCPFNWFRTSGDINSGPTSWLENLQTTKRFQDPVAPLSQPGCWAYPDMLEVGRVKEPAAGTFYSWNRAHFGAWCVISAPLVLGLDLADAALATILDVVTNTEAIQVNQQWSGHPGMLIEDILPQPVPYSPDGGVVPSDAAGAFNIAQAWTKNGPSFTSGPKDTATSGVANIRSGSQGDVSLIRMGAALLGEGHAIESLSMSFRYLAGYNPGETVKDPTVRVLLLDAATNKELATVFTSGPLGKYSWSPFTTFSPPIVVASSGLNVPNDNAVIVALEVTNNDRNLQIPVDDLAGGFNIQIQWAPGAGSSGASTLQRKMAGGLPGFGQLWAKRQPGGAMAAFVLNHGSSPINSYALDFSKLNLTAPSYNVRDIWARTDNGTASASLTLSVPAYDSVFVMLTPAKMSQRRRTISREIPVSNSIV